MGARLVSLVLARWSHLPDRAFRVVVRMALTALDEPNETTPAATYFGGRDPLIAVLRNERGGKDPDTANRTLKRAIGDLLTGGAIERVSAGRAGKNAIYRLTLDKTPASIGDSNCTVETQGDTGCPPQGDTSSPLQGDTGCPDRGTAGVPPRNHDEPKEDPQEEVRRTVLSVGAHLLPAGGHAGPQTPRRPGDPSGRRISHESSTSAEEQQPPQPETATHDRAREADPAPALRLVPGNPDAARADDEPRGIFPAPLPGPDASDTPAPAGRGFGFCLTCHAEGQVTLAVDPIAGDACAHHLRSAAG